MSDSVRTSYLGFGLEVGAAEVLVHPPGGRRPVRCSSVKQARLLIRSFRRLERAPCA